MGLFNFFLSFLILFCSYKSAIVHQILLSPDNDGQFNIRSFNFTYFVELEPSEQTVEVWIPLPQDNEVQSISMLTFDHEPLDCEALIEQVHNNRYYYCYSKEGLTETTNIILNFQVDRKEHGLMYYQDVDPKDYDQGTYDNMVPEGPFFENIIKENDLSENDMRGIYEYVLNGMHYGKPTSRDSKYYDAPWLSEKGEYGRQKVSRDKVVDLYEQANSKGGNYTFGNGNSMYACNIGVGNCTDYHSYFMSLSRTMDVPVRFHIGFSIPSSNSGIVEGYHCWADYYSKGEGWYPIDISEADKNKNKIDYYFGNVCFNRIAFTTGRDLRLENHDVIVNFFVYPIVKGTNYKKIFTYKNL